MTDISVSSKNATHATAALASDPGNVAISSPEQMYSPILINRQAGGNGATVSSFSQPVNSEFSDGQFGESHLGPTREELDPYFSTFLNDSSKWIESNDFQFMANNGTGNNGADSNIRKLNRSTISQVSVNHFRGPLCIAGVGTDLSDRPFPAIGETGEDSWNLDPVAVGDRSNWPTGPVDLKWDAERSVWSGGPHILCGFATEIPKGEICSPSEFTVKILRLEEGIGGGLSNQLFGETITVLNHDASLEEPAESGKKIFVVAGRINYEWIPLWVGCPSCADFEGGECPEESCAT